LVVSVDRTSDLIR